MGWSDCGTDNEGRPIGYAHQATCDQEGCDTKIDRGLSYACGDMHGSTEHSCDRYFCEKHLLFVSGPPGFLCPSCAKAWETTHPDCDDCGGWGVLDDDESTECPGCKGRGYTETEEGTDDR